MRQAVSAELGLPLIWVRSSFLFHQRSTYVTRWKIKEDPDGCGSDECCQIGFTALVA